MLLICKNTEEISLSYQECGIHELQRNSNCDKSQLRAYDNLYLFTLYITSYGQQRLLSHPFGKSGSKNIRILKKIMITKFVFFFWEKLDKNNNKGFFDYVFWQVGTVKFLHISLLFRALLKKGARAGPSPTHAAVQKWQQVLTQLFLKTSVPTAHLLPKFAVWILHQALHICSLHPH